MIRFSEDALAFAEKKRMPLHIQGPFPVEGCCLEIVERPVVRFGAPVNPEAYSCQEVQGVTLYIPNNAALPRDGSLTIGMRTILGFRHLVIDGWKVV